MRSLLPLLAFTLLSACSTTGGAPIAGKDWRAIDVNGLPLAGERLLTLRLDGGRASGNSGCNSFTASYEFTGGDRLDFGPIASTRMACEPAVMEQETRFLSILDAATSYSRYGSGQLSVIAPDGRAIRFARAR
jgi:heat shock protein HslJ